MINVINTKEKLSTYILNKLGYPMHEVELSPEQLNSCIDDSIKEFTEVAMEGQETKVLILELLPDINEYILDGRIKTIQKLATASSNGFSSISVGGVFMTPTDLFASSVVSLGGATTPNTNSLSQMVVALNNIATFNKLFGNELNYKWNEYTKRLTFYENPTSKGSKCLLECTVAYYPAEVDYIYDNVWVKAYALALAKKNWGENIGKYEATLINGSKLNYDRIINEAKEDIEKLREELLDKWTEPLGIIRG